VEIKKAVITAAGKNQRALPLQTLVDRDGQSKAALQILIEEVLKTGIEEFGVVVAPGSQDAFRRAAGPHENRLHFVEQTEPAGYGHAVFCASGFTGRAPFLLMVGDHLYLSRSTQKNCAQQLVEAAQKEACAISAVQATHESKLPYYGAVGGRLLPGRKGIYQIEQVIEKPTPTEAEQRIIVPGLRVGNYLCFFGMHILTATVMDLLGEAVRRTTARGSVALSPVLAELAQRERYLACELEGRRFDIGLKYGLLMAQLALAINGQDREDVLAHLVELLALREM